VSGSVSFLFALFSGLGTGLVMFLMGYWFGHGERSRP